jgi:sec-independent protein translocase protein TatB
MANIGMADTIILMVLALVVFGPRRLPQIGRQIGKLMYEFRKASNDFKFQMEEELRQAEEADRRKKEEAERQKALAAAPTQPALPAESASNSPAASDSATAAPESSAASQAPGEPTDSIADPTRPEAATASAVEAAPLRIQPPSTGEIVAANPPTASYQPPEPPAASADGVASGDHEAERTEQDEPTEPAAHHG